MRTFSSESSFGSSLPLSYFESWLLPMPASRATWACLWQEQEAAGAPQLLDGTRLLDLQASLRIDQRRLPEARALLAEAAARAAPGLPLGRILVNDARSLESLFRRAVELETVTLALVRRLVVCLYRAAYNPDLPFAAEA